MTRIWKGTELTTSSTFFLSLAQKALTATPLAAHTPKSNSRIRIVTAATTASAREYVQAHQQHVGDEKSESKRVHAVWVVLEGKEGSGVIKEEVSFGGEPSELSYVRRGK